MFIPGSYGVALALMITAMIAWGSWANAQKLAPSFPFQLFYWDYLWGVLLVALIAGFTLGSFDTTDQAFVADISSADTSRILYALASGAIFNVANLLLVAAISVAGLAVAFPVAIGLALVVGVLLNYVLDPGGNIVLLGLGVALIVGAIVVDARAYALRDSDETKDTGRGLKIAIASGMLMGLFFPLLVNAQGTERGLGPYTAAFAFAVGAAVCALPVNTYLMKRPLTQDSPVTFHGYLSAPISWHLCGILGGLIWGLGLVCSLVAAKTSFVGPAVSYAIGQGATMVSAAWGVFVWREFAGAPAASTRLLPLMFVLFLAGLALIAIMPLFPR